MTQVIAQIRNATPTQNLNGLVFVNIPIAGEVDELDSPYFSIGGAGVVCNFNGRCRVTVHTSQRVSGTRNAVKIRSAVGGVGQPIEGKTGYIRNTTGHRAATCTASQFVRVNSGDEITLQARRDSDNVANTPGEAGGCMILIEAEVNRPIVQSEPSS